MFQTTKKKIINEVTKEIISGTTLEKLLENKDLANSVLYEPEEFINFLFPPEEMEKPNPELSNLDKLIKLSLDPCEEFNKEKLYRINRNAASILSSASVKIHEKLREDKSKRFFKILRRFINSKYSKNLMFAGHFQRMFEASLQKSREELLDKSYNDGFEENFLPFIIKNSRLLPYRELLSTIMSGYSKYFKNCIEETLRYAAISTLHFYESNKTKNCNKIVPANQLQQTSLHKLIDDQPVNCHHEKIPTPYFMNTELNILESDSKSEDDAKFIDTLKTQLKYVDLKDTDISSDTQKNDNPWIRFALNLIYAVKNGYETCTDDSIKKKVDKDLKDKKESSIVKYLLICGMYADSNSSLSYTSFNLLFNLLNKQHTDSDEMFDGKYILNLHPPKIVDEYAEHFKFNQYDVSERMISALLIFWNHPYKKIKGSKIKTEVKNLVPGYKAREGVTPLQYLLPTILTEPIYSSKLNNIFMRIISSMEQEIIDAIDKERKIRNDQAQKDFNKIEEKCMEFDSIWFDLLTYKFKLLPNDKEETILQNALERMLSLPTTDEFYQKLITSDSDDIYKFYRAPTNPVIFMLSKSINHGPFFSFKKGIDFRKVLKEPFSKEWIQQTFTYCHIVDRMEKQLINTPYEKSKKKRLKVDKYTSEDEMDLQSQYSDKLTESLRFKKGKK